MTIFTISLQRTICATAHVEANSLAEAEAKAEKGDWFDEFENDPNEQIDDWFFGAVLYDDEDNEYV